MGLGFCILKADSESYGRRRQNPSWVNGHGLSSQGGSGEAEESSGGPSGE